MPRRYENAAVLEWRDGNYGKHGVGRHGREARPRRSTLRCDGAATGVAGDVSPERFDAARLRPAGGHPLHNFLLVAAPVGGRGRARAGGDEAGGAICRGGAASGCRAQPGSATAGRHDRAGRAGRGTGRAGAGVAGLTRHAGLSSFGPDLRGPGGGGHEKIVERAVDGGERTPAGRSEERRAVLLHQPGRTEGVKP